MDGEGLKVIRIGHGLTQAQMAEQLGVSRQSYIAWERDKYKMPADKLAILLNGSETLKAAAPKETDKQRATREAWERETIKFSLERYRELRAWPDIPNHNAAMRFYARNRQPGPPAIAHAAILAAFPDIITDPDGDYTVDKAQALATILKPQEG